MNRIIFHIDVNSAFLSWSAIKLLKENPDSIDIRTIPSIIGGDQQTRHGIVVAKSLSAKKIYHIQTAEPVASAMKKCPTLTIIPPDHQLYAKCSKQFPAFLAFKPRHMQTCHPNLTNSPKTLYGNKWLLHTNVISDLN